MANPEEDIHPDEFGRVELKEISVQDRSTIINLLQTLDFPTTRQEIMQRFGKYELRWTSQEPIMLDDVIAVLQQERFENLVELTDAICRAIQLAYGDYSVQNQAQIIQD